MKAFLTVIPLTLALLAIPAYGFQCPVDIEKIEAALAAGTNLDPDQIAEVENLLDEGEAQHNAGEHAESVATLAKAKKLLSIE